MGDDGEPQLSFYSAGEEGNFTFEYTVTDFEGSFVVIHCG